MKQRKFTSKVIVLMITMMLVPTLIAGCSSKSKIRKEVYEGTLKHIGVFESHKNDNYSEPTKEEMNQYIEFINNSKKNSTEEEREIFDKLGDVMIAYSTDSSEVAKGEKPILFDEKVKELKTLLEQYK
ncbi:hypothetical protein GOM49_03880 [Clostridium bovifaecis]|uniref:DUF4363 family protein n=1 Tax=Clostridium bovifaecis TaxID=2184719 RepID=A0A6I6EU36_9CLOT|nr:hypothetical protein GOM49_03880 [Clostridium bovifaecis]